MDTLDTEGITITKHTNEEVTLTAKASEIESLREDLNALVEHVKALVSAQQETTTTTTDTADEAHDEATDEAPAPQVNVSTGNSVGSVKHGDADPHGFVPSSVTVTRPEAPPEPEPEPEPQPEPQQPGVITHDGVAVNVASITSDDYPKTANGIRPSEDPSKYRRGRYNTRLADRIVLESLIAYHKWEIVVGSSPNNGVAIDYPTNPARSLRDWIAFSTGYSMSVSQVRSTLKRLVAGQFVVLNATGKYGKKDAYSLDTNSPAIRQRLTA